MIFLTRRMQYSQTEPTARALKCGSMSMRIIYKEAQATRGAVLLKNGGSVLLMMLLLDNYRLLFSIKEVLARQVKP